jgi:ATP-dependent DNA helicase DinG
MARVLHGLKEAADPQDEGWRYRFPLGRVDDEIASASAGLMTAFDRLSGMAETMAQFVEYQLEDTAPADREPVEQWLSVITAMASRLEAAKLLWSNFSVGSLDPPFARWVRFTTTGQVEGMEIQLSSHPVSVSDLLEDALWSRCAGAVVTSATISVGSDFSNFQQRSGIAEGNRFVSLASPFRYQEKAVLQIPKMVSDPGDADAHTLEIAEMLPSLLAEDQGSLVLFTSWRQMLRVYDEVDAQFCDRVLMQGDRSKIEMLRRHRARVDEGEPSCLFGLASFAEGVDLPGDYCSHVVIAKIPFSVPDDPVDATLSEWVEDRGGNAFYQVMLPNAALRVVQAAGRLLRTESDSGTVTILDRRLVTRRYGRVILDALPPFRRDIQ